MSELSPCSACRCSTRSIRQGRAHYLCERCGHDKSLSDYYYWEATQKDTDTSEVKG